MNPSASQFDPSRKSSSRRITTTATTTDANTNSSTAGFSFADGNPSYPLLHQHPGIFEGMIPPQPPAAPGVSYYSTDHPGEGGEMYYGGTTTTTAAAAFDDNYQPLHMQSTSWNHPTTHPVDFSVPAELPGQYYPIASFDTSSSSSSLGTSHSPTITDSSVPVPISAMAQDDMYDALFIAGPSTSMTLHRRFAHRASRLSTLTSTTGMLYSTVAGHPEAPSTILQSLYTCMYGIPDPSIPFQRIPPHAYQPWYGTSDPAVLSTASTTTIPHHLPENHPQRHQGYQLGITQLVAIGMGHVASVSPAGVRIHTTGGLQIADNPVEGMMDMTPHPMTTTISTQLFTHLAVGGMAKPPTTTTTSSTAAAAAAARKTTTSGGDPHLHVMDLWQGLRIVSSHSLQPHSSSSSSTNPMLAVSTMATSHTRHCIVAGCTDGTLRIFDDRMRSMAKLPSRYHQGGVIQVAVSYQDLVASVGYGSPPKRKTPYPLYGYPDPSVILHDLRFLGRGGYPSTFHGSKGGPRFVAFLPNDDDGAAASQRLLVASGQPRGGLQISIPFQDATTPQFVIPHLESAEAISCLCVHEDKINVGTTNGRILRYQAAAGILQPFATEKEPLIMPSFHPSPSAVSIDAKILCKENNHHGHRVFGNYILTAEPTLSVVGDPASLTTMSTFGPLASDVMLAQTKLQVKPELWQSASRNTVDFLHTVPTSELNVDLFEDHRPNKWKQRDKKTNKNMLRNPNKLIYSSLYNICYTESLNRSKRLGGRNQRRGNSDVSGKNEDEYDAVGKESDTIGLIQIPERYRLTLRPTHRLAASFSHAEYNSTGLIPGYDYPPTMPNAFVSPVVMLLYFIPEIREAALRAQFGRAMFSTRERRMLPELGYLFHRIDTISRYAMLFPAKELTSGTSGMTRLEAWAPSAFISLLSSMPEAERFQILDGSPAAVDSPRRPEAFYRFLVYQLDNELAEGGTGKSGLLDSLSGADFVSINEFISGSSPPQKTVTRQLTVEMTYEYFFGPEYKSDNRPSFGDVLQYNLCRAVRLRAWSQNAKSYETIIQRKIITSLPTVLALSAACAGRKDHEGLALWHSEVRENNHWLPEVIEIEIAVDGSVVIRELITGEDRWKVCSGTGSIPASISQVVRESTPSARGPRRMRYRLDAVVSLIRDDLDSSCSEELKEISGGEGPYGHQVLHVRMTTEAKRRIIENQKNEIEKYLKDNQDAQLSRMTLLGSSVEEDVLVKRRDFAVSKLENLSSEQTVSKDDWLLVNGFVVSHTIVEDARSFSVKFKEPSLIIFRAIDVADKNPSNFQATIRNTESGRENIPPDVIRTSSITDGARSIYVENQSPSVLPGRNDLIALDAEFVALTEEESTLTLSGSKVVVRETRHALARISVLDGRAETAGAVIVDDYVLPNESVSDYLTRFSGIVAEDLDPKRSQRHLISTRAAYLKLRCLIERGCIFVGHGLQQDFWTANLAVPANQIIDTVEIYHKPAQRYVSLRFLTNFVLKRDMQQDVHDSVEDALAALELYKKAVELKENGVFDQVLNELYEYGHKNDWKLGVDGDEDEML